VSAPSAAPQGSDALKSYYDARYRGGCMADHSPLEVERVAELVAKIPPETVRTILDFSCGRGAWMVTLQRRFPNAHIIGFEISTAAIERARADVRDATFATFDGREVPQEDGFFDLVFSYHVLDHVLSLEETAAEMSRLAGRWICVCLPCRNDGSLEARMVRRNSALECTPTGELRFAHDDDSHLRRVTSDEVATVFRTNGFGPVDAFVSNHFWGGIAFLLDAGSDVTHKVFRPRQIFSHAALDAGHLAFRIHRSARLPRAYEPFRRKTARLALVCAKPVTTAVVTPMRALARRAWRSRKNDPAGSAQYLLFERTEPTRPSHKARFAP
jgi:Methyltransferase domain